MKSITKLVLTAVCVLLMGVTNTHQATVALPTQERTTTRGAYLGCGHYEYNTHYPNTQYGQPTPWTYGPYTYGNVCDRVFTHPVNGNKFGMNYGSLCRALLGAGVVAAGAISTYACLAARKRALAEGRKEALESNANGGTSIATHKRNWLIGNAIVAGTGVAICAAGLLLMKKIAPATSLVGCAVAKTINQKYG